MYTTDAMFYNKELYDKYVLYITTLSLKDMSFKRS